MDVTAFTELIKQLQSSDNAVRKAAEEQYDQIDAATKIAALFESYAQNQNSAETRSTVLVFLRRVMSRDWDEVWDKLNEENRQRILSKVLEMIIHEQDLSIKKKIADLISEIAGNLINDEGEQSWKGVLELMNHCLAGDDITANYIALLILRGCPIIFGNSLEHFLPILKNVLQKCMSQQVEFQIRSTAVKAAVGFAVDNDEEKDVVKTISTLAPAMLQVCVETPEDEENDGPLGDFAELASAVPKIVTAHLETALKVCLQIGANTEKGEMARQNAVEVIVSYIESAPKSLKKHAPQSLTHIVELCLQCMAEMDDDMLEDWLNDSDEEEDLEEMPIIGESAIDRIACAMNGKTLLPMFLPVVEKYLTASDWKLKHAALRAFSAVGEGCQRAMEPHIEQFMAHITKFVNDEHPRVRFAACNAIGQMSTDFAPTLQKKCHAQVLPALLQCLENTDSPRVCGHAASALINFCEECPKNVIGQYLPYVLQKLEQTLGATFNRLQDKKYQTVVENVVTAIASVAEAAEDLFKEHHSRLIPNLVHILQNVGELKELRGKTIECISLIGYAVGKEEFHQSACEIMNLLGGSMSELAIDDPQYSYMISSWTRFCAILGSDFAPYLPVIMDPVLRAAQYRPDFSIINNDEADDDENDPDYTYSAFGDGEKSLGIRTSGLEEKATSCEMIVAFAKEMKSAFLPWVPQVSELCLKNLDFSLHDGVRQASAEAMANLIVCVEEQGVDAKRQLWIEFLKALNNSMNEEDDIEILAAFMSALASCIDVMGGQAIAQEEVVVVVSILLKQMEAYGKRMNSRVAEEDDDDDGEAKEDLDYFTELEASLLGSVSELLHSLMKEIKHVAYEPLLPIFQCALQLINSQKHYFERQWGMCIIDDAIEFSNAHVSSQFDIVPLMLKCLQDEYPEVRQAAVYGFGAMALRYQEINQYSNDILQSLEGIAAMVEKSDSRATEEATVATENGISAFAKIILNVPLPPDAYSKCVEMFLSWLPTHADVEESPYIYTCFTELFNKAEPALLGPNNQNLGKIVLVGVTAIANDAFDEDDEKGKVAKQRVIDVIKRIHASVPNIAEAAGVGQDENILQIYHSIIAQQ
ncbi:unnamed protein product [Caenorhabditis angaria]|uniref:Importin N-terminal domain-containing protein n=1 Tax=Caenorhabditis angaria TaxID=860376 RepID=A0A9P1I932_9PELO|nr:unnamed protein product [Caenorhabditis angaria]